MYIAPGITDIKWYHWDNMDGNELLTQLNNKSISNNFDWKNFNDVLWDWFDKKFDGFAADYCNWLNTKIWKPSQIWETKRKLTDSWSNLYPINKLTNFIDTEGYWSNSLEVRETRISVCFR